jgi:Plavaka transposase
MSGANVNTHMQLLAALYPDQDPPFADANDLYATIDASTVGNAPWTAFEVNYTGHIEEENPPPWKTKTYDVWHRDIVTVMENQISNADFATEMDYAPKHVYSEGHRQYTDLMSGNWAWRQAVSMPHHCLRL